MKAGKKGKGKEIRVSRRTFQGLTISIVNEYIDINLLNKNCCKSNSKALKCNPLKIN